MLKSAYIANLVQRDLATLVREAWYTLSVRLYYSLGTDRRLRRNTVPGQNTSSDAWESSWNVFNTIIMCSSAFTVTSDQLPPIRVHPVELVVDQATRSHRNVQNRLANHSSQLLNSFWLILTYGMYFASLGRRMAFKDSLRVTGWYPRKFYFDGMSWYG